MKNHMLAISLLILLTAPALPMLPGGEGSVSDPDGYGYKIVDGNEPEPVLEFDYVNIRSDPNVVEWDTSNYETLIQANLGFNFDYYGTSYSKIYVSTFIAMSFVESSASSFRYYYQKTMPSTASPKGLIAVYFNNNNCYDRSSKRLFTLQTTIDGEKAFIVEWNPTSGGKIQAILYEGGMIKFQYQSLPSWPNPVGSYTLIGIEDPAGSTASVYSKYESLSTALFTPPFAIAFVRDEIRIRDVGLLNGDGKWGDTVYAGAKPYHFRVQATHSRGAKNFLNVILTLGSLWGQENINMFYSHKNRTFSQLSGLGYASLHEEDCTFSQDGDTLTVDFYVDFSIEYPSQEMRNVTAKVVGRSAVPDILDAGQIYWVETEVQWNAQDLYAVRQSDQRSLHMNDYVKGGEVIRFTGIKVFYEDSEVQPPHTMFNILVTDNFENSKVVYIQQGSYMDFTWTSVHESTLMSWHFEVRGFPPLNVLSENFDFSLRVDIDIPNEVPSVSVHPDSIDDPAADNDNDGTVFVSWEPSEDGGSGMGSYIIRAEAPGFSTSKEVPASSNWTKLGDRFGEELPEGIVNISVTPKDDVGNVGRPTWSLFRVDLTGPTYQLMSPERGTYAMSTKPDVTIRITDDNTGIEGTSLVYRVSRDGGYTYGEWKSFYFFGTGNDITRTLKPTLSEGRDNLIQVKGTDIAHSEETISDEMPVWVDARAPSISMDEPLTDGNGTTVEWLKDKNTALRIKIHDFRGSGIDPSKISYRYSTDGGKTFSTDIPLEGEGYNNTDGFFEYAFAIRRKEWNEGDGNILVVEARDMVGRNTTATFRLRFDMVPEVTLISPLPMERLFDNESIHFQVVVEDLDGKDDVSVSWLSNVDGILGIGESIDVLLSPGEHIIQVTVKDGVHTVRKLYSFTVLDSILEDPRYKDTDGDGMNDSYEQENGLNPFVDDSSADLDGDGFTNLEEYYAGTDPADKGSYPGSEIEEEVFPILPVLVLIGALVILLGAGFLLARESARTRAKVPSIPLPPPPVHLHGAVQQGSLQGTGYEALPPPDTGTL